MRNDVLYGDCLAKLRTLPDKCVQTCVTSPPYYGLRDYGTRRWLGGDAQCEHDRVIEHAPHHPGQVEQTKWKKGQTATTVSCSKCNAWFGQIGLEPNPEMYARNLVEIFREVRRVLRDDGTLWLNLGDSYNTAGGVNGGGKHSEDEHKRPSFLGRLQGYKPKDLIGVPWLVAFAMRADGWWLRSEVIWHKPNSMPEAVEDRPSKAHEHVFLLSKSQFYFYDHVAVQEDAAGEEGGKRNKRSVWSINTQAYKGAHFAVMSPELAENCVKAGTSEGGACANCGTPYVRIVKVGELVSSSGGGKIHTNDYRDMYSGLSHPDRAHLPEGGVRGSGFGKYEREFLGWESQCKCGAESVPCIVLDPFTGSGTTPMVARKLNRDYLGIELNESYQKLIEGRIRPAEEAAGQRTVAGAAFDFEDESE